LFGHLTKIFSKTQSCNNREDQRIRKKEEEQEQEQEEQEEQEANL